eukprot:scaffold27985_cov46-Phaeocystis_antarctica.AAC.6
MVRGSAARRGVPSTVSRGLEVGGCNCKAGVCGERVVQAECKWPNMTALRTRSEGQGVALSGRGRRGRRSVWNRNRKSARNTTALANET